MPTVIRLKSLCCDILLDKMALVSDRSQPRGAKVTQVLNFVRYVFLRSFVFYGRENFSLFFNGKLLLIFRTDFLKIGFVDDFVQ